MASITFILMISRIPVLNREVRGGLAKGDLMVLRLGINPVVGTSVMTLL